MSPVTLKCVPVLDAFRSWGSVVAAALDDADATTRWAMPISSMTATKMARLPPVTRWAITAVAAPQAATSSSVWGVGRGGRDDMTELVGSDRGR
jgi:hypothetical protein